MLFAGIIGYNYSKVYCRPQQKQQVRERTAIDVWGNLELLWDHHTTLSFTTFLVLESTRKDWEILTGNQTQHGIKVRKEKHSQLYFGEMIFLRFWKVRNGKHSSTLKCCWYTRQELQNKKFNTQAFKAGVVTCKQSWIALPFLLLRSLGAC